MIRAATHQYALPSNEEAAEPSSPWGAPIRRHTTLPSPSTTYSDPYGPESTDNETMLPPPPSVPQPIYDLRESGTVPVTERSDVLGENIRLRMLLARVANARVCDLQELCGDIRAELGYDW